MTESIERIKHIKSRYEKQWLRLEGVVGVGIGTTAGGSIGIIVSVKKHGAAIRKKLPMSVEDVMIEVQETGEIKAL